ncbi:TPA: hypothetical protein N0F65_011181 [Lagenidium giganteum]|uniref:Uncharacterized protein n=1 Tax=Lagenidium giganteum TaxID=4803 RepID=A0AAV2Z9R9_9STRA|nr:TPA: hypothetical protein N0F65_011181 [Lagenidium giganteum]
MARMVLTPPPVFFGDDMRLCDPPAKAAQEEYCMPVGGRMDRRYCDAPERMELLVPQTPTQICWASVLHLVLLEVYNELQRAEARPLLMHGTLFGAKSQGSLLPSAKATPINDLQWFIEKSKVGHLVPNKKMVPFSNVTINGFEFTTVADPADFLLHNYGNDYVVQHTRTPMETK